MAEEIPGAPPPVQNRPRKQTTFLGDVLKLVSGTTLAQALLVLVTPVLARLYDPAAFGVWGVFVSTVNIITVISCLRYELAIVLPESDEDGANLLAVGVMFSALVSLLTLVFVLLARDWLADMLKVPELATFLWLLPVSVFFGGSFLALNYWNTRTKMFVRLSIAQVSNTFIMLAVQLAAGFFGYNHGGGLIAGSVAGAVLSCLVLGGQILRDDRWLFRSAIHWGGMRKMMVRYQKFPLYNTWGALMNSISWQLPSYLLTYFFSAEVAGYYTFGNRLLRLPMSLIGNSIAQVFFQRSAEARAEGKLAPLVRGAFQRLVVFSLFPLLTLTFIGADFFGLVFGSAYTEAGVYTQILSVWTFFWFISSPLSTLFATLEKQELSLKLNLLILVTRFLSLFVGGLFHDPRLAIILFSASGVITYGLMSFAILHFSAVPRQEITEILARRLLEFLPAALIFAVLLLLQANPWITIAIALLINGLYYLYYIWREPGVASFLKRLPGLKG